MLILSTSSTCIETTVSIKTGGFIALGTDCGFNFVTRTARSIYWFGVISEVINVDGTDFSLSIPGVVI